MFTDIHESTGYFNPKPFKVIRKSFCDSEACCRRAGVPKSKKAGDGLRHKYIPKEAKRGQIECSECGCILYWKSESVYV